MTKMLVTGGTGFIGSNLVEKLLLDGHEVIGIDKDAKKTKNLREFSTNPKLSMIWDNVQNIQKHKLDSIDIIYHLAASADIKKSLENLTMDLENNVYGTCAVLEFMRKGDIKNLVFSSSSAVYGETKVFPTPENVELKPISLYGASKLANEAYIHAYSDLYGIKAWVFRFANVVGKNEGRGVIYDFVNKLNKNQETLEILGDGNQTKSFFDVSDCVSGLIDIPKLDKNNSVEIYNLGNYDSIKVVNLAKIVCKEIGVNPEFKFTGGDRGWEGDVPIVRLSIQKALNVGWAPKYTIEESIKKTVKFLMGFKEDI